MFGGNKYDVFNTYIKVYINDMRQITILLTLAISATCYGQKDVYYYQGTGFDTLTIFENNRFECNGGVGLAKSITYEGEIIKNNDTLLLVQKTPTIINGIDTININDYKTVRIDTLLIIDNKTLMDVTCNNESYYKLIQEFKNDSLIKVYNWSYKDTLINSKFINDYPIMLKNKN